MGVPDIIEVQLEKMAFGGQAIAHLPNGQVIFVPFALPGEIVKARPIAERRGYMQTTLLDVINPSNRRIQPACHHFTLCGGCQYQHIPYADQLTIKTDILKEQFVRISKIEVIPVQPAIPSPLNWNYRNHVQFHLTPAGKLGYLQPHSNQVLSIQECHLPEEPLNMVWPVLEFEPSLELDRVGLRLGHDGNILLILESEDAQAPELTVEEMDISVVHLSPAGQLVLAGSEHVSMEVSGKLFRVSASSFFQVNIPLAERMVQYILTSLPFDQSKTVLDVYCGVGLFSAFLAPLVGRLIGIEASPTACDDFALNLDRFDHVELYEAAAEQVMPRLDLSPDIIIVDPPRAGLHPHVQKAILRMQPQFLVYVSCDPATLARDARQLSQSGYHLNQITPFDLFPQTYHIESISIWEKCAIIQ